MLSNAKDVEALRWVKTPVLDDGFVTLVDVMGDDAAIVQAARVSYNNDKRDGDTTVNDTDESLIRYLMRHTHCYAPWMQVLTIRGWIRWDECNEYEEFVVPDHKTRTMMVERLTVESFQADDGLHVFQNARMSYAVTPDHRMWFKDKYQEEFGIVKVQDMSKWGHFDPLNGYALASDSSMVGDMTALKMAELIGFYLGDGSYGSTNTLTFHLRKERKKDYLRTLCRFLNIELRERKSTTYEDAVAFTIDTPVQLRTALGDRLVARSAEKGIPRANWKLTNVTWCAGIRAGLEASDGHDRDDREQVQVGSSSVEILALYQAVCAVRGVDAHEGRIVSGVGVATSFTGDRTTLESRKQYHSFIPYDGRVYCTTTSTGLLMVRGASDKFAFVCGNSTPFEMAELKFLVRVPMDCWRQWIRHRMASVNEYSTRYTTAIDSKQKTPNDEWRRQSTNNKQGSSGSLEDWPKGWTCEEIVEHGQPGWRVSHGENFTWDVMKNMVDGKMTPGAFLTLMERSHHDKDNQLYKIRLDLGVAKEQARKDLPLSTYTEAYWKIDLHNLMHFLRLRMDSHAQKEIRDYANAIAKIVQQLFPTTWAAFEDYVINSMKLTARDTEVIRRLVASGERFPIAVPPPEDGCWPAAWYGLARCRERDECVVKLQQLMILNKP